MNGAIFSVLMFSSGCLLAAADPAGGLNWNLLLGQVFSSAGVCGLLLIYYMWQIAPALKSSRDEIKQELQNVRHEMERGKRVELLRIAASPHVDPLLKQEAAKIIAEYERKDEQRDDTNR